MSNFSLCFWKKEVVWFDKMIVPSMYFMYRGEKIYDGELKTRIKFPK